MPDTANAAGEGQAPYCERGSPYVYLSSIEDFPRRGRYKIHSRTSVEAFHPGAPHRRDNWVVHRNHWFDYEPD